MSGFSITGEAERDLEDIWEYIARDSLDAADRVRDDLFEAFQKLADMPGMGHIRPDVPDGCLRFWTVYTYLVVYRAEADHIKIIRVLSGYRDIGSLLE